MKIDQKTFIAQLNLSTNFDSMEQGIENGFIIQTVFEFRGENLSVELDAQVDTVDFEWVSFVNNSDGVEVFTASK